MIHVLGFAVLALFFSADLLSRISQLREDFDEHRALAKLQADELKKVQRWIINQGAGVYLPEDKMISKIPPEAFTFRFTEAPIGG